MLGLRIITAAVLAAIIVPLLVYGRVPGVALLVALFGSGAIWELSGNLSGLKPTVSRALTLVLGLVAVGVFAVYSSAAALALAAGFPLLILAIHLFCFSRIENTVESTTHMIFALGYVTVPLAHAILVSRFFQGTAWVFFVLVAVCLADAGAYFAGKYYGSHRFAPRVSPSKTLEGLAGGVCGGLAGMAILKIAVPSLAPLSVLFPLTLLLVAAEVVGDLTASALKRRMGIKDFGALLPGHGGILDRADSLIFAFPVAYYFLTLSGSVVSP